MSLAVVHPESQAVLQPVQAAVPGIQLAFETGIAIIKEGVRLRQDLQPGIPLKGLSLIHIFLKFPTCILPVGLGAYLVLTLLISHQSPIFSLFLEMFCHSR